MVVRDFAPLRSHSRHCSAEPGSNLDFLHVLSLLLNLTDPLVLLFILWFQGLPYDTQGLLLALNSLTAQEEEIICGTSYRTGIGCRKGKCLAKAVHCLPSLFTTVVHLLGILKRKPCFLIAESFGSSSSLHLVSVTLHLLLLLTYEHSNSDTHISKKVLSSCTSPIYRPWLSASSH